MKKSNISITALVILAVLAAASIVAVATADLGIEPCGLKDTYNSCLDGKYKFGEIEYPTTDVQFAPNRVQQAMGAGYYQGGW